MQEVGHTVRLLSLMLVHEVSPSPITLTPALTPTPTRCARAALDALSCRLSLPSFQQLRADRNAFTVHSSAGRAASSRQSLKVTLTITLKP